MNNLIEFLNLPDPTTKAELLERMAKSYEAAESLINIHDQSTLNAPLHSGGWSIKDHLAHLTAWERGMVALLQKQDRFNAMGINQKETDIDEHDAINEALNTLHSSQSLSTVLTNFRQTHQDLLNTLASLSNEDLQKSYHHYQPQAAVDYFHKPVMGWVAGNTYAHYAEHLVEIGRLLQNP